MKLLSKKKFISEMRALADKVERRQRAHPAKSYEQMVLMHGCGAPACLLGHYAPVYFHHDLNGFDALKTPKGRATWREQRQRTVQLRSAAVRYCPLIDFFGAMGCNNARCDWRQAVAFIREQMGYLEQAS